MSIWCLFTQCDSEPSFDGYSTSKKSAIKWVKDHAPTGGILTIDENHIMSYDDGSNSTEAIKLEKIVS